MTGSGSDQRVRRRVATIPQMNTATCRSRSGSPPRPLPASAADGPRRSRGSPPSSGAPSRSGLARRSRGRRPGRERTISRLASAPTGSTTKAQLPSGERVCSVGAREVPKASARPGTAARSGSPPKPWSFSGGYINITFLAALAADPGARMSGIGDMFTPEIATVTNCPTPGSARRAGSECRKLLLAARPEARGPVVRGRCGLLRGSQELPASRWGPVHSRSWAAEAVVEGSWPSAGPT